MTLTSELIRLHRLDQRRHGLAESSIDKRVRLLGHLAARLDPAGLLDADTETLEAWLDTLPLKPKTRYTYVSNLHSFYAWAVAAGHLEADPTASMARPKFPPGRPRPILDDDLAVALDMADPTTAVIVACAAYAGMRCCEIARLTRSDVILGGEGHLWAHGKGGKSRQIPLHPELAAILDRFGMPRSGPDLTYRGRAAVDSLEGVAAYERLFARAGHRGDRPPAAPLVRNKTLQNERPQFASGERTARPRQHHHHTDLRGDRPGGRLRGGSRSSCLGGG